MYEADGIFPFQSHHLRFCRIHFRSRASISPLRCYRTARCLVSANAFENKEEKQKLLCLYVRNCASLAVISWNRSLATCESTSIKSADSCSTVLFVSLLTNCHITLIESTSHPEDLSILLLLEGVPSIAVVSHLARPVCVGNPSSVSLLELYLNRQRTCLTPTWLRF